MSTLSDAFNRFRSSDLPPISEAVAALLEVVWYDDYESFGLINSEEDPASVELVKRLIATVERDAVPVLSDAEVEALKEAGWHDADGELAIQAMEKVGSPGGYPSDVWKILEDLYIIGMEGS